MPRDSARRGRPTRFREMSRDLANQTGSASVRTVVTGESELLGEWVGARYARAYRTAVLICGNPADAEEAVQDAFLRAWRFRDALPDRRSPRRVALSRAGERLLLEAAQGSSEARHESVSASIPTADRSRRPTSPEVGAERSAVADALSSTLARSARGAAGRRGPALLRRPERARDRDRDPPPARHGEVAAARSAPPPGRRRPARGLRPRCIRRHRRAGEHAMIDELVLEQLLDEIARRDRGAGRRRRAGRARAHRVGRAPVAAAFAAGDACAVGRRGVRRRRGRRRAGQQLEHLAYDQHRRACRESGQEVEGHERARAQRRFEPGPGRCGRTDGRRGRRGRPVRRPARHRRSSGCDGSAGVHRRRRFAGSSQARALRARRRARSTVP